MRWKAFHETCAREFAKGHAKDLGATVEALEERSLGSELAAASETEKSGESVQMFRVHVCDLSSALNVCPKSCVDFF